MKKILMVAVMLFAGLFTYCYGQDVKVNINNQDYSTNNGEFKINGISSSEDIGGVDVQFVKAESHQYDHIEVIFENYNTFPVTVLCKTSYKFDPRSTEKHEKTYSIVLGTRGKKVADVGWGSISTCSVEGMIVRKVGQ